MTLLTPYEVVAADAALPGLSYKLGRLAKIDPAQVVTSESDTQTLSLFGREDLIAASSYDYTSTGCAPVASITDVMDEVSRRASKTSIVIINESHERSQHRGFTADIARRLRPLGYDTLALETLENPAAGTAERYWPPFLRQPSQSHFADGDGYYLSEAGYGRLGREAKAIGYRLLPYEDNLHNDRSKPISREEQIAQREEAQANNLAAFLRSNPAAKLLVHVGYSHASEVTRPDGQRWMAARLKDKTGIDPLTVSQTTCHGGGKTTRLAALPSDQPVGTFDLVVDHPTARFIRGRPEWRRLAGDKAVSMPRALRPAQGWRVIEARLEGEPATSVPTDRVAIRPGEDVALMLPPGRYRLRAIDVRSGGGDLSGLE